MPVKSAHDLVMAAKQRCQEVELEKADAAIRQANVLIDVREPDEYSAGHLTGAINWPRGLLEFKLSSSPDLEQRDLSIVVYCRTGGRSALAACSLLDMGYLNVLSLAGGYEAWVADGRATTKPEPLVYD